VAPSGALAVYNPLGTTMASIPCPTRVEAIVPLKDTRRTVLALYEGFSSPEGLTPPSGSTSSPLTWPRLPGANDVRAVRGAGGRSGQTGPVARPRRRHLRGCWRGQRTEPQAQSTRVSRLRAPDEPVRPPSAATRRELEGRVRFGPPRR
jgi:hypothetical protein